MSAIDFSALSDPTGPVLDISEFQRENLRDTVTAGPARIDYDEHCARLDWFFSQKLPSAAWLSGKFAGRKAVVIAGGASAKQTIEDVRAKCPTQINMAYRAAVVDVNKTDWLVKQGIRPDFKVIMEPAAWACDNLTIDRKTTYLLGATMDPVVIQRFIKERATCYFWIPTMREGEKDEIARKYPGRSYALVAGKSTIGMRTPDLLNTVLGFSHSELHGYDSCYPPGDDENLYSYPKFTADKHRRRLIVKPKTQPNVLRCVSNTQMSRQCWEYVDMMIEFAELIVARKVKPFGITVAGDGAIPWLAWRQFRHATPERMQAKYGNCLDFDYALGKPTEKDEPGYPVVRAA